MARERIVVLGGGCAAMATVFALTSREGWKERYDITVYQPGWRLGGKGAAGRNAERGDRIEEHGLHLWSGFYENAFWMMRRVYGELRRPTSAPLATLHTAFRPRHFAGLARRHRNDWIFWKGYLPQDPGLPGDLIPDDYESLLDEVRSPWKLLCEIIPWALRYLQTQADVTDAGQPAGQSIGEWLFDNALSTRSAGPFSSLRSRVELGFHLLRVTRAFAKAKQTCDAFEQRTSSVTSAEVTARLHELADRLRPVQKWLQAQSARATTADGEWPELLEHMEVFCTIMIGMLRDGVVERGFDVIDDWDLLEWLGRHGLSARAAEQPTLRSLYSYVFAFEDGDTDKPNLAAGVALRMTLRLMLCSRGAVFWEMRAGMGDTIFAPIYEVLHARGVKFRFFHHAREVKTRSGQRVDEIRIGRQATLREGDDYHPLRDYREVPGWPSHPVYEQLVEGERMREHFATRLCDLESAYTDWPDVEEITLRVGEHFDRVVLGVPMGVLTYLCPTLCERNPRFEAMVKGVTTVRTQGAQLWMDRTLEELGWRLPSPVISAYGEPYDTWADLTELLEREDWGRRGYRSGYEPRSLGYFCGVMGEDRGGLLPPGPGVPADYSERAHEEALKAAERWFATYTHELWPKASPIGTRGLDYSLLHAPDVDRKGLPVAVGERIRHQYISANIDPSARYVQSRARTTKLRLTADGSGFSNLVLSGDWTLNGLNYGCVEAAVMGGLQAARAIDGWPKRLFGEHDFPGHSPFARSMAPSVRRGAIEPPAPPWNCPEASAYLFYLRGHRDCLQELCDRSLNIPSGSQYRFEPITDVVVLSFQQLRGLHSQSQPEAGVLDYNETAFWVPVRERRSGIRYSMLIPYIFCGSGLAMAAGREHYGFPKQIADIGMPVHSSLPERLTVRLPACSVPGGVFEPTDVVVCELASGTSLTGLVGAAVGGHAALPRTLAAFGRAVLQERLDFVFLRQVPALQGAAGSSLRQLVTAQAAPFRVRMPLPLAGSYRVRFNGAASHPIVKDLGLVCNPADGSADALLAARCELDFVLQPGHPLGAP
jgi:uncharacterized protein with NAD-binding domain and iron-sulfur cluster